MTILGTTDDASLEHVLHLLRQALRMYKEAGPDAMKTLTESFLLGPGKEGAMADAFEQFDGATDSLLKGFAARHGFDLSESATYRKRFEEGYFSNMYPVIFMYMIWLDRECEEKVLENYQNIFASAMFGVAGYGILDSNLDEGKGNPAEVLLCLAFIQEHERLLMETFEADTADYALLNRCIQLYLAAEVKEKRLRFVRSPYTTDHPEDCGYKAVHTFLPFGLLLRSTGRESQVNDYLQLFYEWGAPLQIMDDLNDLEDDIKNGHYSYPTLGFEESLSRKSPSEAAKAIKSDVEHTRRLQQVCRGLIEKSRRRSVELGADLLGYFVSLLEARLDSFFSNQLVTQERIES